MKKRLTRLSKALAGHGERLFWAAVEGVVGGAVGLLVAMLYLRNR